MDVLTAQTPLSWASSTTNLTAQCLANMLPTPTLFGAEILNITSSLVSNYTASFVPPSFFNSDPPMYDAVTDLSFCNVTVAYTHPGQDDTINVNLWLPVSVSPNASTASEETAAPSTTPAWNGVFLSRGGGGFLTGLPDIYSHGPLIQGYAISTTDGGHSRTDGSSESWALASPGNVNLYLVQDFASVALHDMAVIGKAMVESFYGVAPAYSYFQGCSTGGRQGLMLAQRYPHDYDGILAAAPAIYFPKLLMSHYWAQVVMNQLGEWPHGCELDAIHQAVIDECDDLDGVEDGVVSAVELCQFDPFKLVGTIISCAEDYADDYANVEPTEATTGTPTAQSIEIKISHAAAQVAASVWRGPVDTNNASLWHPLTISAPLSLLARTKCFHNGSCTSYPSQLASEWLRLFMYKDAALTVADLARSVTHETWVDLFHQAEELYHSLLSTSDANLAPFARHGGKIITWHGLSDESIMPGQSRAYYDQVVADAEKSGGLGTSPNSNARIINHVTDYYRLFLAPGVEHCGSGPGALPINVMAKLRAWVERGLAPDVLESESMGIPSHDREDAKVNRDGMNRVDHQDRPDQASNGDDGNPLNVPGSQKFTRPLCMYPQVARYLGHGDTRRAENFECADSLFASA